MRSNKHYEEETFKLKKHEPLVFFRVLTFKTMEKWSHQVSPMSLIIISIYEVKSLSFFQ